MADLDTAHLGPDAAPSRPVRAGRRAVAFLAGACVVLGVVSGCSSSSSAPRGGASGSAADASYGSLPSYLPTSTVEPDSVLTGSAGRPALTTEGDSVDVSLAGGTVRATVTGPVVPGEGLPEQTEATTCTWTVTLRGATATTPIRLGDFTTLDHLGTVYRTRLAPGSRTPPAQLAPGATTTFSLRTVMPTGEGLMRWTAGGRRTVASWDFEVEND
ncbi:hypothetical protein [uncultured Jatrophihabitans sp.]|uniref:hypothetical protein n=1 Tax=uncultured Jatrophihabitans sp. TaxID=1610747 RepID=UPI0035CA54D3